MRLRMHFGIEITEQDRAFVGRITGEVIFLVMLAALLGVSAAAVLFGLFHPELKRD